MEEVVTGIASTKRSPRKENRLKSEKLGGMPTFLHLTCEDTKALRETVISPGVSKCS